MIRHLLIAVALLATPFATTAQEWVEGRHYQAVPNPEAPRADGKITVSEFFWYGCPSCFAFEPHLTEWLKNKPEDVEFNRYAASLAQGWRLHARAYYTAESLGVVDQVDPDDDRVVVAGPVRGGVVEVGDVVVVPAVLEGDRLVGVDVPDVRPGHRRGGRLAAEDVVERADHRPEGVGRLVGQRLADVGVSGPGEDHHRVFHRVGVEVAHEEDELVEQINASGADILFVAFGAPVQDKWIARNLPRLHVKMAMGVGGTFDFIAGIIPRAPMWAQKLGLEWLYRLYLQPWRIKRMSRLPRFVLAVLREGRAPKTV